MSGEFGERLERQIDRVETWLLESYVLDERNFSGLQLWTICTRAILEKELGSSSGIVDLFVQAASKRRADVSEREQYEKTLEECLDVLKAVRDAAAPLGE